MQKSKTFVDVFTNLGDFALNADALDALKEFACHLYGHEKQKDVHDVIKRHFQEKNKLNCIERPLENIKSVEPTTFPPCTSVQTQYIKRGWHKAKLYKFVSEDYPVNELIPIN